MGYLLSFVFMLSEMISLSFIADAILKRKNQKQIFFYLVPLLAAAASFVLLFLIPQSPAIFKLIVSMMLFFAVLAMNYNGALVYKIIFAFVYYIIVYAADFVIATIYIFLMSSTYQDLTQNAGVYVLFAFTSKLLLLTSTYLFKLTRKNKAGNYIATSPFVWALLSVPALSVFNMIIVMQTALKYNAVSIWTTIEAVFLLVCNIAIIFVCDKLDADNLLHVQNMLLEQEVKQNMEKILALESLYLQQRKLSHDFKNHLQILQSFLKDESYTKAVDYINELSCTDVSSAQVVHSNNQIVDIVLNQKYYIAVQNGISVSFMINDLSKLTIPNADLVTLLSNALDNAIEAAEKCDGDKLIRIKILSDSNSKLVISIRNTSNAVDVVDNNIKTTKENAIEHGFGLKNIHQIITRYDGEMFLSYLDGFVQFTAKF